MKNSNSIAGIQKRTRFIYMMLIGILALLLLRIGYMQLFYNQNVLTFAQMDQKHYEENKSEIHALAEAFDLDLSNHRQVNMEELVYSGRTDSEALSLLDIIDTSCAEGCFGQPVIYLDDSDTEGYVFIKDEQKQNVLIEIIKEGNQWSIIGSNVLNLEQENG